MNIVAVDHETATLNDLTEKLRTVFPTSEIKGFQNPIEPLQYAQKHKIDLLFTDVRLHPFDGYELVKILGNTQNFYSYIVSGSKEYPDDLRWMKVNGTFTKPISVDALTKIREEVQQDGLRMSGPKEEEPAPAPKPAEPVSTPQKPSKGVGL